MSNSEFIGCNGINAKALSGTPGPELIQKKMISQVGPKGNRNRDHRI